MATKAIVGEKVGMTQIWDDQNRAIPVTVLRVAPVRVVQVKTPEQEGYSALQVTWGFRRPSTLTKPELGHYERAGVDPGRRLVELRLDDIERLRGRPGDHGRPVERRRAGRRHRRQQGQGLRRRHEAPQLQGPGGRATATTSTTGRPGSIGACATPSRVFKGTRMAGRMGGHQVTALNLEVVSADPERELVLVKGAVPGPRGGVVVLRNSVKTPTAKSGRRPMSRRADAVAARHRPVAQGAARARRPARSSAAT